MAQKDVNAVALGLGRTRAARSSGASDTADAVRLDDPTGVRRLVTDEDQFRLLVDAVEDHAIISLDVSGRVTGWNIGAQRIKGYEASEVLGRHFALFYSLDDIKRGKAQAELAAAREAGRFEEEAWRVRKGGERFWAHIILTAVHDPAGGLRGFAKITRDLTERQRARSAATHMKLAETLLEAAEKAKHEAEAAERRLVTLIGTMGDGYFTLNEEWRFSHVNASLAHLLGKSGRDLVGASFWDEVTDSVHSKFFKQLPSLLTGTAQVSFTEFHEPTNRWFAVRANRSEGKIAVFLRDVTTEHEGGAPV